MGLHVAAGGAQRMLHVQHFVEEDVLDDEGRHGGAVETAIQDDLVECGIEAAELGAPVAAAPAKARAAQTPGKIAAIQASKHGREIVRFAPGTAVAHGGAGA